MASACTGYGVTTPAVSPSSSCTSINARASREPAGHHPLRRPVRRASARLLHGHFLPSASRLRQLDASSRCPGSMARRSTSSACAAGSWSSAFPTNRRPHRTTPTGGKEYVHDARRRDLAAEFRLRQLRRAPGPGPQLPDRRCRARPGRRPGRGLRHHARPALRGARHQGAVLRRRRPGRRRGPGRAGTGTVVRLRARARAGGGPVGTGRRRALLVLTLVVTPAAAAARVTASPVLLPLLSVVFAVVSIEGGILSALGSSIPISPYVPTISFTVYVACRLAGGYRTRRWGARRPTPQPARTTREPVSQQAS